MKTEDRRQREEKTVFEFGAQAKKEKAKKDLAISYTVTGTKNASLEVELHLKCQDIDVKKRTYNRSSY